MLALSITGEWSVLDIPWFAKSLQNVPISFRRCANRVQRYCKVSILANEFSVVAAESQEASDVLTILRLRPIKYRTWLLFLGVDAAIVKVRATKIEFLTSQGTFCTFGFEAMFC
jgi:hypothetical protein